VDRFAGVLTRAALKQSKISSAPRAKSHGAAGDRLDVLIGASSQILADQRRFGLAPFLKLLGRQAGDPDKPRSRTPGYQHGYQHEGEEVFHGRRLGGIMQMAAPIMLAAMKYQFIAVPPL
jgi:hypothetical protein